MYNFFLSIYKSMLPLDLYLESVSWFGLELDGALNSPLESKPLVDPKFVGGGLLEEKSTGSDSDFV